MKSRFQGAAALVACLCLFQANPANAQRQREYQTPSHSAGFSEASNASYDSFELSGYNGCTDGSCTYGSCDSCGVNGLGLGANMMRRQGQFFFTGEYIYARSCFSEALAYIVSDPNDPEGGQEIVEYDFDYTSSYRFGGGYRLCDCGGEIVFNFARYRSGGDFSVNDTSTATTTTIFGPYEIDAPADGGTLTGRAEADIRSYDLGFSKTIPLGSPLGCYDSCTDTCCGDGMGCGAGCGSGWCPAWDITWSAGVRFAQAGWGRQTVAFDDADPVDMEETELEFEGAGARVGVLGRRYFGRNGFFSAYAKGDFSLLAGDMTIRTDTTDDLSGTPQTFRSHSNTGCRIIPVTEIEAGVTGHLAHNIQLSAGYFLSAWHDMGMRDMYDWTTPGLQINGYDDANILGFDGFFARAEIAY